MNAFLNTHAGKATLAGILAGVVIVWPPAVAWLVAAAALSYSAKQFRESFRLLDEELPTSEGEAGEPSDNGDGDGRRTLNVDELVASLLARTADENGGIELPVNGEARHGARPLDRDGRSTALSDGHANTKTR